MDTNEARIFRSSLFVHSVHWWLDFLGGELGFGEFSWLYLFLQLTPEFSMLDSFGTMNRI
jgi:hypothetical protein